MRSILKATAMLGGVSLVNIVTGLVSAKVSALLLGPIGLGQMALLQALLTTVGAVSALGISAGLIRFGAHAIAEGNMARFDGLRRGAAIVLIISGIVTAVLMACLRRPLAELALGNSTRTQGVMIVAAAVGFVLAASYHNSILNAHHRVADLARVGLTTAILGPAASITCIVIFREAGVAWAVLAPTVVGFAAAAIVHHLALGRKERLPGISDDKRATGELLRFGLPFTLSMLLGAGTLYLMPVLVLNQLGELEVGYYRAGSTLAITYLGFLLTTLQQDYNPRVSAVQHDTDALQRLINEQLHVILLIGTPLIFGMIAFAPIIVRVVFSDSFAPAIPLLEWQLIGDIFKFASWTMAFVILARLGSRAFLLTETFGGAVLLSSSWFLMKIMGLQGLGIAFTATSAIYCVLCWIVLRWNFNLAWTRSNTLLFTAVVSGLAMVALASVMGPAWLRSIIALIFAVLAALYSTWAMEAEFGTLQRLRARLQSIKASQTSR